MLQLNEVNKNTTKENILRWHHMLHNNSDTTGCVYPGLTKALSYIYKTQIIAYSEYMKQSTEQLMQAFLLLTESKPSRIKGYLDTS